MSHIFKFGLLLFLTIYCCNSINGQPYNIEFKLEISERNAQSLTSCAKWMISLRDENGTVLDQEAFPFRERKQICPIQVSNYGVYTAYFFLDLNNNGKLDQGVFGQPKEPYAFSNNARNYFGKPSITSQKFNFFNKDVEIYVLLNYHFTGLYD
ncbi:MAG: Uncharacterised protein [Owenweeksia sp. TMED14]|nr:MAG: Uncharacterised protein [Owenweeksia sp. TMED14]